jgi:hypothetical protein
MQRHLDNLAKAAATLAENMETVLDYSVFMEEAFDIPRDVGRDCVGISGSIVTGGFVGTVGKDGVVRIDDNIRENFTLERVDRLDARCLLEHFHARFPQVVRYGDWSEATAGDISQDVADTLEVLSRSQNFGVCDHCPVCRDIRGKTGDAVDPDPVAMSRDSEPGATDAHKPRNPLTIDVGPNSYVGRELTLLVHNQSEVPVVLSASMTCTGKSDAFGSVRVPALLLNAAMVWERSGESQQTILPGGREILKLCGYGEKLGADGSQVRYMRFYRMVSGKEEPTEFAHYSADSAVPAVEVAVHLSADLPLQGFSDWTVTVEHIPASKSIAITSVQADMP